MLKLTLPLILIFSISACKNQNEENHNPTVESNPNNLLPFIKSVIDPILFDPDSAEYKNIQGFCGEINVKDQSGQYEGFKKFIILNKDQVIFKNDQKLDVVSFADTWKKLCTVHPEYTADGRLIPPSYNLSIPVANPTYHSSENSVSATANAMSFNNGQYIHPTLYVYCRDGETQFTLDSSNNVSAHSNGYIGISSTKSGQDIRLVRYISNKDGLQKFGTNMDLYQKFLHSDKLNMFFQTQDTTFIYQTFDTKKMKKLMRQYENSCDWHKL